MPYAWAPGWNSPQAWNKFQAEIGGHLRGGDAGINVFAANGGDLAYMPSTVAAADAPAGAFRVLALHRHFGGEELSSRAQPIADRAPQAMVVINAADAQRLGINGKAVVTIAGETLTLPTHVTTAFPAGAIGLPVGFAGVPAFNAESMAELRAGAAA